MTGLGETIVRKDEVRLVEDTDGDGYADKSTVWAGNFNSIQGMAFRDGRVFVMHSPFLTVLRDSDGDGVADERRDVLSGLGWPPEKSTDRLHGANGVVPGHDGWLYLALGDRGCDVPRPEGDRLVLHGGGILRCRLDGTDLHVFSTGLRNIYDIALDEELNVFVRDNENDGGNYLIRVCHSFMGADHGYPYLYQEHPDEAVAPLAELGRGSSAGGVAYLERGFPAAYQGALFFCEWGRSVVWYPREHKGAGFAPMKETAFAAGAPDDPYGFRPTDVVVDRDGSFLVSDWADGQRPKRGRGRVYRIQYEGAKSQPAAGLESESYHARIEAQTEIERRGRDGLNNLQFDRMNVLARLHAVWVFAHAGDWKALLEIAARDPDSRVRAQVVRAIADLFDPVLVEHRLEAGRGNAEIARRLSTLGRDPDPRVLFEATVALGRLRWIEAPGWLRSNIGTPDPTLAHAALQTLRRSGNWPAVLEWLDHDSPLRSIALRALAEQAAVQVVDGLIHRLGTSPDPKWRREYADLLSRVHRKPGPWVYWGFRPEPRPPNTESWEKSAVIETALDRALADPDSGVRLATLQRMEREKIPMRWETLIRWLRNEQNPESVAAILSSLNAAPPETVRAAVEAIVRERAHSVTNRLSALQILVHGLDESSEGRLLDIARSIEESAVLAEMLRQIGRRQNLNSQDLLLGKLRAAPASVRVVAVDSLAELGAREGRLSAEDLAKIQASLLELLDAGEATVRAAAATAMGKLQVRQSTGRLMARVEEADPLVRLRSLEALTRLREPRAIAPALRFLEGNDQELLAALKCLAEMGEPAVSEAIATAAIRSRSTEVLQLAAQLLLKWDRASELARIQGASGVMLGWKVSDALSKEEATRTVESILQRSAPIPRGWRAAAATNADSRVNFGVGNNGSARIGVSEFVVPEASHAEFRLSSSGMLDVWLNGKPVHHRSQAGNYATDSERFDVDLEPGLNRLVTQVSSAGPAEVHARFRRKSPTERHERLSQLALATRGNATRGREIFFNAERTGCIKCHHLGDQGGGIGPDLTGVGRRFSRIHLIESILEPSRAIAPAFRNLTIRMKDGQELTGVRVAESDSVLTVGDAQGQLHALEKDQIEERHLLELSIMPEGLEEGLTDNEFVDLVAFLAEEK
jgi:putative membrane-bound dehydrogenase-like protein